MPNCDDYSSDESSFYGDEDEKRRLEQLVTKLAEQTKTNGGLPSLTALALKTLTTESVKDIKLYNPYEGELNARQLGETADAFVHRVPPSTSSIAEYGPWLWVANPHTKNSEGAANLGSFSKQAQAILEGLSEKRSELERTMAGKAASTITKKYSPHKQTAEAALLEAAKANGLSTGKWMLFPSTEHVDDVWKVVVEGTITGELGISAKVATDDGGDPRKGRLICVYTRDFSDLEDVRRVIRALHERDLGREDRGIYYKCDAYTHADISSGNKWGLKASLYASKDLLKASGSFKG